MRCWKCGAELAEGHQFCGACGAKQSQDGPEQRQEQSYQSYSSQSARTGGGIILSIFAAICMAVCAGHALRSLVGVLRAVSQLKWLGFVLSLRMVAVQLAAGIAQVLLAIVCALTAFKRTGRNSDGLLVCQAGCIVLLLAVNFVGMLLDTILLPTAFATYFGSFVLSALGMALIVGGTYLIERFVLGESPLVGKNVDDLKLDVMEALSSFQQTAGEVGAKAAQAAQNAKERQAQQQAAAAAAQQARYNQYNNGGPQGGPGPQGNYYQQTPPTGPAPFRLKTDRSLLMYILLSFVTCGIYPCYFVYALARDVNVACAGDGRSTAGLIKLCLLTCVTCGLYYIFWHYNLGNRLAANAPRYGMTFQENGTTVLLWMVIGVLACGIGPFISLYILIKNTNLLCGAYNYQHGI